MTDEQITSLLNDAVADVKVAPDPAAMSNRLSRVDGTRRMRTFVVATAAMIAAMAGVAAAWPADQQPIELRVGDGGVPVVERIQPDQDAVERPVERVENAVDVTDRTLVEELGAVAPAVAEPGLDPVIDLSALVFVKPDPTPVPQLVPAAPETSGNEHTPSEHSGTQPKAGSKKGNKNKDSGGGQQEPPHEPAEEGGATHTLTATAAYGSCEEPIPYDIYSGTAAPGATVTISSPWSATATATADASGHWSRQVTFEAAPVGQSFTVTLSSGGQSIGISFVRTG